MPSFFASNRGSFLFVRLFSRYTTTPNGVPRLSTATPTRFSSIFPARARKTPSESDKKSSTSLPRRILDRSSSNSRRSVLRSLPVALSPDEAVGLPSERSPREKALRRIQVRTSQRSRARIRVQGDRNGTTRWVSSATNDAGEMSKVGCFVSAFHYCLLTRYIAGSSSGLKISRRSRPTVNDNGLGSFSERCRRKISSTLRRFDWERTGSFRALSLFAVVADRTASSDAGKPRAGVGLAARKMQLDKRAEPEYGERVPFILYASEPGALQLDQALSPEEFLADPYVALSEIVDQLLTGLSGDCDSTRLITSPRSSTHSLESLISSAPTFCRGTRKCRKSTSSPKRAAESKIACSWTSTLRRIAA